VRYGREFSERSLRATVRQPNGSSVAYSWDLDAIMSARDAQLCGRFALPARLAVSMRTDDAIFTARRNRLAPLSALSVLLTAADGSGARGRRVADDAEQVFGGNGTGCAPEVVADLHGDLADHGFGVGHVKEWLPRADGSRIDPVLERWPLDFVTWDSARKTLVTQVQADGSMPTSTASPSRRGLSQVDITHGDGEWIVVKLHDSYPWQQDAAIVPGSLVWASHAISIRSWNAGATSHANAKIVGEMADDEPLQVSNEDGTSSVSPGAAAFLDLLLNISNLDTPVGIKPPGSKIEYLTNTSRAWEVWERLATNRERAAARVWSGNDAALGATGGAPGVDIATLFGVATTIVQGDVYAISRGIQSLIDIWSAVNYGDSSLAPARGYGLPDPDVQREREDRAKNETAFAAAINARRGAGLTVTQEIVDELAERYGVTACELAATQTSGMVLTPSTIEKIARVDEGRQAVGLPPTGTPEGQRWIAEIGQAAPAAPLAA
jgi:hypothetical protein